MSTVQVTYGHRDVVTANLKQPAQGSNPDLIVGMEIEVEGCRNSARQYTDLLSQYGWKVHTDGSLREVNGLPAFEFISVPMASKDAFYALEQFFKATKFGIKEGNFSDRTSVHVHVNCLDLEWKTLASLALLYQVVEPTLFGFINHDNETGENHYRDTNIYCIPWSHCRDHYNLVQQFISAPDLACARWQKYTALNLQPLRTQGTVEFRHMHGTSDMKKLTTWLNIIGSLFKAAKSRSMEDWEKEVFGLNTYSNYERFFMEVLGGNLAYLPDYQPMMEEGCILAKYSILSYKEPKKSAIKRVPISQDEVNRIVIDDLFRAEEAGNRDRLREILDRAPEPLAWGLPDRHGIVAHRPVPAQPVNHDAAHRDVPAAPEQPLQRRVNAGVMFFFRPNTHTDTISHRAVEQGVGRGHIDAPPEMRSAAWARARGFEATVHVLRDGRRNPAWNSEYDAFVADWMQSAA